MPSISSGTLDRGRQQNIPKVLRNDLVGILIPERQHAAARVLDEDNLVGAEQLLADDDAAEAVSGGGTGLCGKGIPR